MFANSFVRTFKNQWNSFVLMFFCQKHSKHPQNTTSPTDTDAQYLYIFCIISHIIVASISIDCKINQKFDKLYQKALLFLFARLANDFIPYSSSSSSYTLSPINMMNNRKNETAENNNAIKSTTAKEEKGSIFVITIVR